MNTDLDCGPHRETLLPASAKHLTRSRKVNGFGLVYPALASIPDLPQHLVGRTGASGGWGYINGSLLVAGMWGFDTRPRHRNRIMLTAQCQRF